MAVWYNPNKPVSKKKKYGDLLGWGFLIPTICVLISYYSFKTLFNLGITLNLTGLKYLGVIVFILGSSGSLFYIHTLNYKKRRTTKLACIISLVLTYLLVLILFGKFYSLPCNVEGCMYENNTRTNLTFQDGYYFSAVTITTLGYGDIVPKGFFRTFAASEAIAGLLYMGIILYIITREEY